MDSASEVAISGRQTRAYVHRVNHGGNYCGHSPCSPRLDLVKEPVGPGKTLPGILLELQERVKRYYSKPTVLPSLRNANRSRKGRQQRSERREACLILLSSIIAHTDLVSLRVGVPTRGGFVSLTLDLLVEFTGLHMRRAERAMADLKRANLIKCSQPRQLKDDGSYRGLAAVKAVNKLLFTAFGLGRRLQHETQRATKRLAKKVKKAGGTLTSWARNMLVIQGVKPPDPRKAAPAKPSVPGMRSFDPPEAQTDTPPGVNPMALRLARMELARAIKMADPDKTAEQANAEADQIIQERSKGRFTA